MPRTKFDSNRTDSSGEEDVLVSVAKTGGRPLSPWPWANGHAEHKLTSGHAAEAPHINFNAFGTVVPDKKIFEEKARSGSKLGSKLSPFSLECGSRCGAQTDKASLPWFAPNLMWIGTVLFEEKTFSGKVNGRTDTGPTLWDYLGKNFGKIGRRQALKSIKDLCLLLRRQGENRQDHSQCLCLCRAQSQINRVQPMRAII